MSADLLDLLERLTQLIRSERSGGQLRPVHHAILWYLGRANRFSDTTSAVAAWLGQTKGSVSTSLHLLRERGLVVAVVDARDARRRHWRLTPAGKCFVEADAVSRELAAAVGRLPSEMRTAAREALAALLTELLRHRGARAFGICRTCRHFQEDRGAYRCALLGEPLSAADAERYCYEWSAPGG